MFPWNLFPFNKDMKDMMQKLKPEEVENFIQGIMGKMMPSNFGGMNPQDLMNQFRNQTSQKFQSDHSLKSSCFETHNEVFVRIHIENEEWLKQMRIFHTSNQLIVEHIPLHGDKHTVTLPAIVKKKGAFAKYKDSILEIKIPKNIDFQYSEVNIIDGFS